MPRGGFEWYCLHMTTTSATTEYRRITAADLTAEPMAVEIYSHATGEWQTGLTARIASMSNGSEFIVTGFANGAGGGKTYPKHHGILARVAVEPAAVEPAALKVGDTVRRKVDGLMFTVAEAVVIDGEACVTVTRDDDAEQGLTGRAGGAARAFELVQRTAPRFVQRNAQIRALAECVAQQANALDAMSPNDSAYYAKVRLLAENLDTLKTWTAHLDPNNAA